MSRQQQRRFSSALSQSLLGLKSQVYQLLDSLDPVAAFNHLHYEGIVNKDNIPSSKDEASGDEKRQFPREKTSRLFSETYLDQHQDKTEAKKKLEELVEKKSNEVELQSMVTALTAFGNTRSKTIHHPEAEDEAKLISSDTSKVNQHGVHEMVLLGAFEQGTHGYEELCELLEEKAQLCSVREIVNYKGKTLLHLACYMMLLETVEELIKKYKCDPNAQDADGNTPLHEASRCRKVQIAKYLSKIPTCNPNIQNENGDTPLHVAISKQHWGLSRELFQSGRIDLSLKNNVEETVIDVLERFPFSADRVKMMKVLMRSGSVSSLSTLGSSGPQSLKASSPNDLPQGGGKKISFGEDSTTMFNKKQPSKTVDRQPATEDRSRSGNSDTEGRDRSGSKVSEGRGRSGSNVSEGSGRSGGSSIGSPVRTESRGILRPYKLCDIQQATIGMDSYDDSKENQKEVKTRKRRCTVTCYNCCPVLITLCGLLFAILLCVAVLTLLIVFLIIPPPKAV